MNNFERGVILVIVVVTIYLHFVGLHNVDLAWNFANASSLDVSVLEDCNAFNCQTVDDMYLKGITALEIASFLSIMLVVYLVIRHVPS